MLDIKQKIEEINRKPEHIRKKFMYGAVFVCMVFVVVIWLMSMKINFSSSSYNKETQEPTSIDNLIKNKVENKTISE